MNSIERVKAAMSFSGPDRVPVWKIGAGSDIFWLLPLPSKKWQPGHRENEKGLFPHVGDDFAIKLKGWVWKKPEWAKQNPDYKGNKWLKIPREEIDQWGCIWIRTGKNTSMGHPGRPSLPDWSSIDDYLSIYTPDPYDDSQYTFFANLANNLARSKYRLCTVGQGPSHTIQNMRGFKNFLLDHRKHPRELKELLEYLTEWHIKYMDGWIKSGADPHGFHLSEDLGTQRGPFVSPKVFEEFYEPVYRILADAAHERGCDWIHHCCGKVDRILPFLIDWGTDAMEFDSPRMSGYSNLKPFRGKIMFWACVNIQSIYTRGSPEECEREVWHMMRNLGTKDGGFGAFFYPTIHHILAPKENVKAFERGLEKYGVYSKIPHSWWDHPIVEEWDNRTVPLLPPSETVS